MDPKPTPQEEFLMMKSSLRQSLLAILVVTFLRVKVKVKVNKARLIMDLTGLVVGVSTHFLIL